MSHPLVVNVRNAYSDYTYVGRGVRHLYKASEFGNPFKEGMTSAKAEKIFEEMMVPPKFEGSVTFGPKLTREEAVACYRLWLLAKPNLVALAKRRLKGRKLGCWCAPLACHADVLAEIANAD